MNYILFLIKKLGIKMNNSIKKKISVSVILIILISTLPLISSAEKTKFSISEYEYTGIDKELNLLKGNFYYYFDTTHNLSNFNFSHAFPPEYNYQHPIYLEIMPDTTAEIIDYKIENQIDSENKIINFSIGPINTSTQILLHFNCWILTESYNHEDLPEFIEKPKIDELPDEIREMTNSSEVVQSNNFLIKARALQLSLFTKNNLLTLAQKIARFCKYHRYLMFLLQYNLQGILQYAPQDALTTLMLNGECPGRSHLGCALFRANNVPARVVLAMPTRYEFWYEMHYMMEYFSKDNGWILTEVHGAETPYPPQEQIILRICNQEDENNTQADFIYPRMKYLERWLWIDQSIVSPYYKDLNEGSKIKSFEENSVTIDSAVSTDAINLTKDVYSKFEYYLDQDLAENNLRYFDLAIANIKAAINELKDSSDAFGYIYYLHKALDAFNLITV
jgi:hypothetical protein